MEDLLQHLLQGYSAPVWLVTVSLASKLLSLDKAAAVIWTEVARPYFDKWREQSAHVVRGVMLEDVIYSRYMQIARHLISTSFDVLIEVRDGRIKKEQVGDRLRIRSRDAIENARQALARYSTNGTLLSKHLETLSEDRKTAFYGPICADIILHAASERYYLGYESIRTEVLRESDVLLREAIDFFEQ